MHFYILQSTKKYHAISSGYFSASLLSETLLADFAISQVDLPYDGYIGVCFTFFKDFILSFNSPTRYANATNLHNFGLRVLDGGPTVVHNLPVDDYVLSSDEAFSLYRQSQGDGSPPGAAAPNGFLSFLDYCSLFGSE